MSVLVKGMEKPEHCGYCRFRYDGICHALQKTQYSMDECPLAGIDDAVPVVRCKDCRWWDNSDDSPFGYCMAMKHGYMSANWEIGIYRKYKGDFYCADGEKG